MRSINKNKMLNSSQYSSPNYRPTLYASVLNNNNK